MGDELLMANEGEAGKGLMGFLRRYLETGTVVLIVLSVPLLWEMWRMPLSVYEAKGDVTVIREGNCRKIMKWGTAGCAAWGFALLMRVAVRGQRKRKYLKLIPLVLAGYIVFAAIRIVQAIRIYPWYFD